MDERVCLQRQLIGTAPPKSFRRLKTRIAAGALGEGTVGALRSLRVTLRESPVAWAACEGPLV